MKSMRIKALLISLPLLLTSLSACVSPAKSGGNKSADDEGGASSQSQSGGDTITIKFWHTFGQTVVDSLKSKVNDFKKAVKEHDGVDVEVDLKYQGGYDDIAKQIADGYTVPNIPTIAVAYPDNVSDYLDIGKSANDEFVVNLDKFIAQSTHIQFPLLLLVQFEP